MRNHITRIFSKLQVADRARRQGTWDKIPRLAALPAGLGCGVNVIGAGHTAS